MATDRAAAAAPRSRGPSRNDSAEPGLLVSADIIIDRRNLIEWLFDPLFAAGRRG
ncbi:MAG: hypothetical protein NXI12_05340 [Alphaproteobacteria bacterium]|nr:hypothetical protein [Alphaproteobacteria bacterium]